MTETNFDLNRAARVGTCSVNERPRTLAAGRKGGPKKQAKVLEEHHIERVLAHIETSANAPLSDSLKFLLSVRAGLRTSEIADLTIDAMCDADGNVAKNIVVVGKGRKRRTVPMHPQVRDALLRFRAAHPEVNFVAYSKRWYTIKRQTRPATKAWFLGLYKTLKLQGCSSHSGRRTFITNLARMANQHNRSLRDVQQLAGHARLETTGTYIDETENLAGLVGALGASHRPHKGRTAKEKHTNHQEGDTHEA